MKQTQLLLVVAVAALIVGVAHEARATDGVKLLKQPKTFPIVISAPGSYRLKSNLTVPDENTTAISVQADYVTIDLNRGPRRWSDRVNRLNPLVIASNGVPISGLAP